VAQNEIASTVWYSEGGFCGAISLILCDVDIKLFAADDIQKRGSNDTCKKPSVLSWSKITV